MSSITSCSSLLSQTQISVTLKATLLRLRLANSFMEIRIICIPSILPNQIQRLQQWLPLLSALGIHCPRTGERGKHLRPSLFTPQLGIYDAEAGKWYAVERSKMPKHDRPPYFPQLVQHKGTVFYVMLCQSDHQVMMLHGGGGIHQLFVKTWCFVQLTNQPADNEFEAASMSTSNCSASDSKFDSVTWTKVRAMPSNVFEALERIYTRDFYDEGHDVCCEGQGGFIYFYCVQHLRKVMPTTSTSASAVGRTASVNGVVLHHDFEKNEWTFLKHYPPFEDAGLSTLKLESFRPSFLDI